MYKFPPTSYSYFNFIFALYPLHDDRRHLIKYNSQDTGPETIIEIGASLWATFLLARSSLFLRRFGDGKVRSTNALDTFSAH